MSFPLTYRT